MHDIPLLIAHGVFIIHQLVIHIYAYENQKHAHQNEFIRTIKLCCIARGQWVHTWCYNSTPEKAVHKQNYEMSKNLLFMHLPSIHCPYLAYHHSCFLASVSLFSLEVSVLVIYVKAGVTLRNTTHCPCVMSKFKQWDESCINQRNNNKHKCEQGKESGQTNKREREKDVAKGRAKEKRKGIKLLICEIEMKVSQLANGLHR